MVRLRRVKKLTRFPAAFVGFIITMIACARAYLHLKNGQTHYWPKANRDTPSRPVQFPGGCSREPQPQTVEAIRSINRRTHEPAQQDKGYYEKYWIEAMPAIPVKAGLRRRISATGCMRN